MRCYHSALVPKVVSKNLRLAVRFYSKKKWDAHILENIWKRIKVLLFFFQLFILMKNDHLEQHYYLG